MSRIPIITFLLSGLFFIVSCHGQIPETVQAPVSKPMVNNEVQVGAKQTAKYFPMLKGKRIGMVVNQTSVIDGKSTVDSLLLAGLDLKTIFSPEHGFRGDADAGAQVKDGKDIKTGLPIISLYGKNKKPTEAQFANLDIIIFDIQDVGARFYTYISTLHYVMQTCAETGTKLIVLDRPNPNGNYIDGPILEQEHSSFVGLHSIPIVHGMTVGEYAHMVNGLAWLGEGLRCELTVIPCMHYTHSTPYILPVKPSPNLPNNRSIYLYPSLCLFEGTTVSVGRGTAKQFQIIGHPESTIGDAKFTPVSMPGATRPKHQDKVCRGFDLSTMNLAEAHQAKGINLDYLIQFYQDAQNKDKFFMPFFTKLAGTQKLQAQIEQGMSAAEIKATWQEGLQNFATQRKPYLLYPE